MLQAFKHPLPGREYLAQLTSLLQTPSKDSVEGLLFQQKQNSSSSLPSRGQKLLVELHREVPWFQVPWFDKVKTMDD